MSADRSALPNLDLSYAGRLIIGQIRRVAMGRAAARMQDVSDTKLLQRRLDNIWHKIDQSRPHCDVVITSAARVQVPNEAKI